MQNNQPLQYEQSPNSRWKIVLWFLALAVAAGIFLLSAQQASESKDLSGQMIRNVAAVLIPGFNELPPAQQAKIVAAWQKPARKAAHGFMYFVLGSVCLLALLQHSLPMKSRIALALGISVVYAFSDELHQLFVEGRAFQLSDVGIDAAGAITGILLVLVVYKSCGFGRKGAAAE